MEETRKTMEDVALRAGVGAAAAAVFAVAGVTRSIAKQEIHCLALHQNFNVIRYFLKKKKSVHTQILSEQQYCSARVFLVHLSRCASLKTGVIGSDGTTVLYYLLFGAFSSDY